LSAITKLDIQRTYIAHLKEQMFLTVEPKRKDVIESPCEILNSLEKREGTLCMTNYELVFFYNLNMAPAEGDAGQPSEPRNNTIHFFDWNLPDDKAYQKKINLSNIKEL